MANEWHVVHLGAFAGRVEDAINREAIEGWDLHHTTWNGSQYLGFFKRLVVVPMTLPTATDQFGKAKSKATANGVSR